MLDTSSAVKLYLKELVELIASCVSSQSWEMKIQAASAIATIADNAG